QWRGSICKARTCSRGIVAPTMPRSGEGTRAQTSTGAGQMWMGRLVAESSVWRHRALRLTYLSRHGRASAGLRASSTRFCPAIRRSWVKRRRRWLFTARYEPVLQRRGFALVLDADPVGVIRRGGLIAGGRRSHCLARRLAGERRLLRLRGTKGREHRAPKLFGFGAEIGGHHWTLAVLGGGADAFLAASFRGAAGLVEFVRPQRPLILFYGEIPLQPRLFSRGCLLAAFDVRVLGPRRRFGRNLVFAARRRQIPGRRHHQRRALAIVDAFLAVPPQPQILHEAAQDLGVEGNVLVVVIGSAGAARAPRDRDGQRDGRGGGHAPQPPPLSLPHSYPLQMTAKCAVSPWGIVARIRALLRRGCRSESRTGARPPPRRWR